MSPTLIEPPNDVDVPLIVIALLSKALFGILVKDAPLPENVVAVIVPVTVAPPDVVSNLRLLL